MRGANFRRSLGVGPRLFTAYHTFFCISVSCRSLFYFSMWRWTYKFLSSSAKSLHLLDQIFIQFNCINSYLPRMPSPLLDHLFTFFFLSQIFYIIVLHSALGNAVRAWGLVLVFFLWFIARSCQTPQPVLTPGQIWLPWTMPSLSVQWYTACCKTGSVLLEYHAMDSEDLRPLIYSYTPTAGVLRTPKKTSDRYWERPHAL